MTSETKAPIRIELMNKGFADLSLTTWARRQYFKYDSRKTDFMQVPLLKIGGHLRCRYAEINAQRIPDTPALYFG